MPYEILHKIKKRLFGPQGGLTLDELGDMSFRKKFSDYLPWEDYLTWMAFEMGTSVFKLTDNCRGSMWELFPMYFSDEKVMNTLESIFRLEIPDGTVFQVITNPTADIEDFVSQFEGCRVRHDDMSVRTIKEFADFFRDGAQNGADKLGGIPFRNFRVFFTFKIPEGSVTEEVYKRFYTSIEEALIGANLCPMAVDAATLLDWARKFFNNAPSASNDAWDEYNPLRKQVIFSHTDIEKKWDKIIIGEKDSDGKWIDGKARYFKCVTAKNLPYYKEDVSDEEWVNRIALMANRMMGGMWGMSNDIDQIRTQFLFCMNIVYEKGLMPRIEKKSGFVQKQKRIGSWAKIIEEKQWEFDYAATEIKRNTKFFRVIPIMWVYDADEGKVNDSMARVTRLWESEGFIMQRDIGILPILFTSSLPFGLRHIGKNVENIDRDFILTPKQFAPLLPIQGDFTGNNRYIIPISGRKGQVGGMDLFHSQSKSHSGLVSGGMGAGKTVLMNLLVDMYYTSGSILRMVEIGRCFKRTVKELNGRHIEFTRDSDIRLNPFTHLNEEDFSEDIPTIASVICQMIFSSGNKMPSDAVVLENTMSLVKNAVQWAWHKEHQDASPTLIHRFLKEYPTEETDMDAMSIRAKEELTVLAHMLAYNMRDFVGDGCYAHWFNGKSTLDMSSDELVCLELEDIKRQTDLYNVATLQIMNEIGMDLYLSDRTRQRIQIFEEVADYLRDNPMIEGVVDGLFRRGRKYHGSTLVVLQSLMFLKHFGRVGDIINSNAEYKLLLEGDDYHVAAENKLIDLGQFVMKLLKSVQTKKRYYGEFAVSTKTLFGVGRIVLPPFVYYKYTSDAKETAEIDAMVAGGMTYEQACDAMVKKYIGN